MFFLNINKRETIYWWRLITITGFAQFLVQCMSFLSGILVVRLLPVNEYALYTLANTMLGAMTILSDGGISVGVMAQGSKVWQNKEKLGFVLATGLDLRNKFAIGSLGVSVPVLVYLLLHHGASWITVVLISISLIPAFYASLSDNILQIPLKLHQTVLPLQKNQIEVSLGRLLLMSLTVFAFPWAFVALTVNSIPRIWGNMKLRKISEIYVDKEQTPDKEIKEKILKIVKRNMPDSVYYCVSGQLTIWIISFLGQTTSVAQLGALGRISSLLVIFNVLMGMLVVPRFAKLIDVKSILRKYLLILFYSLVLMAFVVFFVYFSSDQILWILGKEYYGLQYELVLIIICSCLNSIMSVSFSLYMSRGWILNPFISILSSLSLILTGCFIFDVSTIYGVLYMSIFSSLIMTIIHVLYGLLKICKLKIV